MLKEATPSFLAKRLELPEEGYTRKVGETDDREEEEEWREEEKARREVEECESGKRLEEDAEKSKEGEEASVAIGC